MHFFSKTDNDNNNNNYNDDDATSNIINLSISLMNFFTIRIPVQSILKILKERFPHTIYNIHKSIITGIADTYYKICCLV